MTEIFLVVDVRFDSKLRHEVLDNDLPACSLVRICWDGFRLEFMMDLIMLFSRYW